MKISLAIPKRSGIVCVVERGPVSRADQKDKMKNIVMQLQSINPCSSGFGEYELSLGSDPFYARTTGKIMRHKNIEGKVHYGGYAPVISVGFEDREDEPREMFVWLNATPSRRQSATQNGFEL